MLLSGLSLREVTHLKKSERIIRNERIREYAKTHTFKETAAEFGLNKYTISEICAGMRNGYVNQYAPNGFNPEETVSRYLKETGSEFDYISGYTNSSGKVLLRCQKCGTETERSMETIRHGTKIRCHVCDPRNNSWSNPRKKYANETEKRRAYEKRKQQRDLFEHYLERLCKKQERHKQALLNAELRKQAVIEKREARRHDCPVCGTSTTRRTYCSDACSKKANNARHEIKRRHTIRNVTVDKDITLEGLFRRDNGRCWICGLPCDYSDIETTDKTMVAGNLYPSIDHVVALSDGGEHSWKNVKLAHRICNTDRYKFPPRRNA